VHTYKENVIFWSLTKPSKIIKKMEETAFWELIQSKSIVDNDLIIKKQSQGAFPLKKYFVLTMVVLWNLLFVADLLNFYLQKDQATTTCYGVMTAIALLFFSCILVLFIKPFRLLVLKEGRTLNELVRLIGLILPVCTVLLAIVLMVYFL
jgi:hypothetical protein